MKKKMIILLGFMLIIIIGSTIMSSLAKQKDEDNEKITLVTTFYPMYVIAKNVVGDNSNVEVVNLTDYQSGCLHDYQLTTSDMRKLENADILIMNGGGMESFIQDVLEAYPNLPMINTSEGIDYLISEGHDHSEDEANLVTDGDTITDEADIEADGDTITAEGEDILEEEYNAHVWLNMNYYMQQIQIVQDALAEFDSQNGTIYQANGTAYQEEVKILKEDMETTLEGTENTKVVIFHDAFAYLAQELELDVIHTVNIDSEASLSAGEIAEVVDEVNENQIKILFTEEQYSTSIADNIAGETGTTVYVIDSIVSGDMSKDGYITGMKKNLEVLKLALATE